MIRNLSLIEHRISQGGNPNEFIAFLLEDGDDLPAIVRKPFGRRDLIKGIAKSPLTRVIGQQALAQLGTSAVKSLVSPGNPEVKKEIAPEYKGGTMPVNVSAFAAHNAHRKVSPGPSVTPKDFFTDTHMKYPDDKDPDSKPMSLNPSGHPVNLNAYEPRVSRTFREAGFTTPWRDKAGKFPDNKGGWEAHWKHIQSHNDIHYAKVDNGVIAYDNPFHEKFKDSLDPAVRATHVNDKTGEITKFKVPVDFDANELRSPDADYNRDAPKHIQSLVTSHYNTRVSPGANLDLSIHRRLLRNYKYDSHWDKNRFMAYEHSKNWEGQMTNTEKYGTNTGDIMGHHGFEHGEGGHGLTSGGYGVWSHPDLPNHRVAWGRSSNDIGGRGEENNWKVGEDQGERHSAGGIKRSIVAQGEGLDSFHDWMHSKGLHVKPPPSPDERSKSKISRFEIPDRLKRVTEIEMHPDGPNKGWTATSRPLRSQDKPETWKTSKGTSAEELRDFLKSHHKDYEHGI
jgi:hypothetical protein